MKMHVTAVKMCYQLTEGEKSSLGNVSNFQFNPSRNQTKLWKKNKFSCRSLFYIFSASGRVFCCLVFCLVYVNR